MSALLSAEHITQGYGEKVILEDINLVLNRGEIVSLLGVSGTGKTTLFHVLSGLTKPREGRVLLNGEDVTGKPGKISYMLQKDLLFQHKNSFTEPLNGSLWYLPAILFMHLLIDWCRKGRHLHAIMITLCFLSVILYAANKRYEFLPNLTPIGIFSRLPYYYIGYVMGQRKMFRQCHFKRDLLMCLGCFSLSSLVFFWHLHEGNFLLHIVLFYPVNLLFLFGTLYGCLLLDRYKANIVINLSIGTLVIIGLHYPLVSLTNLILKHLLGLSGNICYHWYTALPVTIIILAVLYPIIVIAKRHFPILLGKKDAKGLF